VLGSTLSAFLDVQKRSMFRPHFSLNRVPGWCLAVLLAGAILFAYLPALQGSFLWDDQAHVTRPDLRSLRGLGRIWFDVGATQQYYPLLHSAFWFEHRLWGDASVGYHLVTLLFHILAACLVLVVLRRLKVRGAFLAAAIFALHPVNVESVAWIAEQKNTLSAVFYLGAMLAYLRFDQERQRTTYVVALGLFVLGLMTKPVVATLPGALLVICWWQRGGLSWRRDVWPLSPWFVLGGAAGLFMAWVERKVIGAQGAAYELNLLERLLLAARVIWFYLGETPVAGRPHVRVSALGSEPDHLVAVSLPPWGGCPRAAGVVHPTPVAWAVGRISVFCWHPVSGHGVRERVLLPLLLRSRSFSIPGEPGSHRRRIERHRLAA